jgi:hypothetical protein
MVMNTNVRGEENKERKKLFILKIHVITYMWIYKLGWVERILKISISPNS